MSVPSVSSSVTIANGTNTYVSTSAIAVTLSAVNWKVITSDALFEPIVSAKPKRPASTNVSPSATPCTVVPTNAASVPELTSEPPTCTNARTCSELLNVWLTAQPSDGGGGEGDGGADGDGGDVGVGGDGGGCTGGSGEGSGCAGGG